MTKLNCVCVVLANRESFSSIAKRTGEEASKRRISVKELHGYNAAGSYAAQTSGQLHNKECCRHNFIIKIYIWTDSLKGGKDNIYWIWTFSYVSHSHREDKNLFIFTLSCYLLKNVSKILHLLNNIHAMIRLVFSTQAMRVIPKTARIITSRRKSLIPSKLLSIYIYICHVVQILPSTVYGNS